MSARRDNADIWELASAYLDLERCPGGRLIVKGYICMHCGEDTSYGGCKGVKPHVPKKTEP